MENQAIEILRGYTEALGKLSDDDINLYKKVVKFMSIGDYDTALKVVEGLCERFPFDTIFLKTMAACLQKQEKYPAAIAAYRTAHLLVPDVNFDCLYFCGICHYKIKEFAEAKSYFERFMGQSGGEDTHKKRAALYLNKMAA